ncbi:MAG: biotin-dependent carboxyltransferase family protein [Herbiconiux sp.]|nr:biotin-dependent carboxyltransferase family protein [Herbiconiux sp.]
MTAPAPAEPAEPAPASLEVIAAGPLTLLQDAGRPGLAHLGVTASGAADLGAYGAANRLVGNRVGSATLETVLGGLEVRALRPVLVAVTGAPATLDVRSATGRTVLHPTGTSITLGPGERLRVLPPAVGLRSYLAVRGGVDAEPVLGSRSRDVLSGMGPPPLQAGDLLRVAGEEGAWPSATLIPPPREPHQADAIAPTPGILHLVRGPRDEWFGDAGWHQLLETTWDVTAASNRVGVRVSCAHPLRRAPAFEGAELPSEGMVAGAVQVPPDGQPVVFLRDHPVTGGYPVIGVLAAAAIDLLAQVRPGDAVRFAGR